MKWMVVTVSFLIFFSVEAAWGQSLSSPSPLAGSRVFGVKGCAHCHAVNGVGAKIGPDLGLIRRPDSLEDFAAVLWNHLPLMAHRMRQLGITRARLDPRETADLIAFLFTLNYFGPPGNIEAGRQLFTDKKCVVCHQVAGAGGAVGPNLDFFKQHGTPIFVAAAMWNHGPAMTEAMRVRGIKRPTLTDSDLRDLIAYLRSASQEPADASLHLLPGRVEEGQRLFVQKRCAECHGPRGQGDRMGPALAGREAVRSLTQFGAALWNKEPVMLRAMKARQISLPELKPEEMVHLVAYLDTVRYFPRPGDPRKGWRVLADKGCLGCHSVSVRDAGASRNLAQATGLDSAAAVLSALWNHALVEKQADGRGGAWPQIRPDEMRDLVTLLRSLPQAQGR